MAGAIATVLVDFAIIGLWGAAVHALDQAEQGTAPSPPLPLRPPYLPHPRGRPHLGRAELAKFHALNRP